MRPLIGIILYLLSFCGRLGAAPIEVTSEPNNTFMKKIIETNWNQLNTQFIPNGIFNTPELIKKAGYPMEAHVIITKDSYILTLHRIPGGNSSLPVLLQHGFLSTSVDWVILGKGKALAFLLADQGYDVWLGNFRGNTYSKAHIFLSPSDTKFWDFSYNEMGIYDIPAMITFITNMRSQPLHTYIGYSMGAGSFYIMASEHPEIAQMVEMMISLAPGVFLNHMQSFIQYLVPFKDEVKTMIQLFFHGELHQDFINFFIKYVCDQNSMREICFDVMSMIWGYDREQFNNTLLPIILSNDPASTSIKTLTHFGQSEIIRKAGYPTETHVIMTEDGYLLTLYRIPGGNGSPPVLLQHGFFCTSAVWIILGKGKALPYLLADQGYDVWLGNLRGSTYSRSHISLSSSESKFWDFSFNELGIYDLPAMITFIINMTSQPLHAYIGHSMGSTVFYVMATERPKIAQMVQMKISLAPTVFFNDIKSWLQYLAFLAEYEILVQFVLYKLLQINFLRSFLIYGCNQYIIRKICINVLFVMFGHDHEQLNYTLLPVIFSHFPAGGSFNTIVHYTQVFQSGKFRQYDYGRRKNLFIYNSVEPPEYDLANIMIPIALFYGPGDWLEDHVNVKSLYRILPNVVDIYQVPWSNFNHMDFIWAKDAPKLVYERVLKIIKSNNVLTSNQMMSYQWNISSAIKIKDEYCTLTRRW
ncbi:lipase 3-like [Anoplolepis gracilipes]|uniref:lipase 3-like n=1 Tax=Anoplolepis gracilipes TaxID=354296 RepID=UPI003BA0D5F7